MPSVISPVLVRAREDGSWQGTERVLDEDSLRQVATHFLR